MTQIPVLQALPKVPFKKWVIAKPLPDIENPTGIIETIDKNLKTHRCKIIAAGPACRHTREGDIIRYTHNIIDGLEFLYKDEKVLFLHEDKHLLFKE